MSQNGKIAKGLAWNIAERFGVLGTRFILQMYLARLLDPSHYGTLSLMIIFTNLAYVFIQQGFNAALIRDKDVTEEDTWSVFWVNLAVAAVIYILLYLSAPLIGRIYHMPDFAVPFRVVCLMLFPGAINSVHVAIISRKMDFRKIFFGNMAGVILSGLAGIYIAKNGGGIWALVWQTLLSTSIACIVMQAMLKWKVRPVCNLRRVKIMISYGWKILVSDLISNLYQDVYTLVTGLKFNSSVLGFYNRGKQFPQFVTTAVSNTIYRVMLPAFSAEQDDREKVKTMMRQSVMLSAYILFPVMAGLAGVAKPMIRLFLTDKWLPAVPYMQIYCFVLAFNPLQACGIQAINAIGRSDVQLKLESVNRALGLTALLVSVMLFDSPVAIAMTSAAVTVINCFVYAVPNKKHIGYRYREQIADIVPSLLASLTMLTVVLLVGMLQIPVFLLLMLQIISGVAAYLLISFVFRMKGFRVLWGLLRKRV